MALDEEDLAIVSAHVQDAVMKVEDIDYAKASKQFVLAMNRFAWEAGGRKAESGARTIAAALRGCCRSGRRASIPGKKDDVLSLLAIRFGRRASRPARSSWCLPATALIRLDVECIEAQLTDLGGAWTRRRRARCTGVS